MTLSKIQVLYFQWNVKSCAAPVPWECNASGHCLGNNFYLIWLLCLWNFARGQQYIYLVLYLKNKFGFLCQNGHTEYCNWLTRWHHSPRNVGRTRSVPEFIWTPVCFYTMNEMWLWWELPRSKQCWDLSSHTLVCPVPHPALRSQNLQHNGEAQGDCNWSKYFHPQKTEETSLKSGRSRKRTGF